MGTLPVIHQFMKKLFIAATILLLAAACNKQQPSVQQPQVQPVAEINQENDKAASWQTYTSSTARLTFKYPKEWGVPKESMYDGGAVAKDEMHSAGKNVVISFSKNPQQYPYVVLSTGDFAPYEGDY